MLVMPSSPKLGAPYIPTPWSANGRNDTRPLRYLSVADENLYAFASNKSCNIRTITNFQLLANQLTPGLTSLAKKQSLSSMTRHKTRPDAALCLMHS
eukprot:4963245-Amphidinium_carterae.1